MRNPVGDSEVGEFYELGGHAVQLEGFGGARAQAFKKR